MVHTDLVINTSVLCFRHDNVRIMLHVLIVQALCIMVTDSDGTVQGNRAANRALALPLHMQ